MKLLLISSFVTMFSNVVRSSWRKNEYLWSKGLKAMQLFYGKGSPQLQSWSFFVCRVKNRKKYLIIQLNIMSNLNQLMCVYLASGFVIQGTLVRSSGEAVFLRANWLLMVLCLSLLNWKSHVRLEVSHFWRNWFGNYWLVSRERWLGGLHIWIREKFWPFSLILKRNDSLLENSFYPMQNHFSLSLKKGVVGQFWEITSSMSFQEDPWVDQSPR